MTDRPSMGVPTPLPGCTLLLRSLRRPPWFSGVRGPRQESEGSFLVDGASISTSPFGSCWEMNGLTDSTRGSCLEPRPPRQADGWCPSSTAKGPAPVRGQQTEGGAVGADAQRLLRPGRAGPDSVSVTGNRSRPLVAHSQR